MMDEKAERSNIYRTHREDEQRLITNCGKVYMLTIGQCTQALRDKLKEDGTWDAISDSYNSIGLLTLIEKYVLKQTESHNPLSGGTRKVNKHVEFCSGR